MLYEVITGLTRLVGGGVQVLLLLLVGDVPDQRGYGQVGALGDQAVGQFA